MQGQRFLICRRGHAKAKYYQPWQTVRVGDVDVLPVDAARPDEPGADNPRVERRRRVNRQSKFRRRTRVTRQQAARNERHVRRRAGACT